MTLKREIVISTVVCIVLGSTVFFGIQYSYVFYQHVRSINSKLYDSRLENPESHWLGPKIGQGIDLNRIRGGNGSSLRQDRSKKLLMILVIDPTCVASQLSVDQMQQVESRIKQNEIDFALVSFKSKTSVKDVESFANLAKLNSNSYSFDGEETDISPGSQGLQYPAFILTDTNGVILRIFAGTSESEQIRTRMSDEIMDDTLREKNRFL